MLKVCTDERGIGLLRPLHAPPTARPPDVVAVDPTRRRRRPRPVAVISSPPVTLGVLESLRSARRPTPPRRAGRRRLRPLARPDRLRRPRRRRAPPTSPSASRGRRGRCRRWLLAADLATDRNRRLEALRRAYAHRPHDAHVLTAVAHERRVGVRAEEAIPLLDEAERAEGLRAPPRSSAPSCSTTSGSGRGPHGDRSRRVAPRPRSVAVFRARLQLAEHAGQVRLAQAAARHACGCAHGRRCPRGDRPRRPPDRRPGRGDRPRGRARCVALRPEALSSYAHARRSTSRAIGEGDPRRGALARAVEIVPDEPGLWTRPRRARGAPRPPR
jgi:hypothetical protein